MSYFQVCLSAEGAKKRVSAEGAMIFTAKFVYVYDYIYIYIYIYI